MEAGNLFHYLKILIEMAHPLFFREAFKFSRRVRFALRRKMRKPPITRLPAI